MKTSMRKVVLVSTLLTLPAALAVAQATNAAAKITGAAGLNNIPPALPPPAPPAPPAPPTVQVNAAAQGATAAGTAVRPPAVNPAVNAAANSAAGTHAAAGVTPTTGVNANATTNASATGQTRGLSTAVMASHNATVAVDPAITITEIQGATFSTRKELATGIDSRINASMKAVNELQQRAEAAGDKSRQEFAKALVEVRAREKALRSSLKAATMAKGESTWGEVQSALAKDYSAYAEAVASAETAANSSTSVSGAPQP